MNKAIWPEHKRKTRYKLHTDVRYDAGFKTNIGTKSS